MKKNNFYAECYIIDDEGKRVSPKLKVKDPHQLVSLVDIAFYSELNVEFRGKEN